MPTAEDRLREVLQEYGGLLRRTIERLARRADGAVREDRLVTDSDRKRGDLRRRNASAAEQRRPDRGARWVPDVAQILATAHACCLRR